MAFYLHGDNVMAQHKHKENKMKNIYDITNVTDAVLDVFLATKSNPNTQVDCDHLTTTERYQLANLMNWDLNTSWVGLWIASAPTDGLTDSLNKIDYEGAILTHQEVDPSWWD